VSSKNKNNAKKKHFSAYTTVHVSSQIFIVRCPHDTNKKIVLLNLFCVACISQSATLTALYSSALLLLYSILQLGASISPVLKPENQFFFNVYFILVENKKGTVGGVAGISQSTDLYCSLLLCFTSALLYPADGRVNIPSFFHFYKNPLGLVL
jgi:hypothetical protein